jgi:hypothetical protein
MAANLFRDEWRAIDSTELMILLKERIGGIGQFDSDREPKKFCLPSAGSDCRIKLTFRGGSIVAIDRGAAFDQAKWDELSAEIKRAILSGSPKTGRDTSFSNRRVTGGWAGANSGVRILPPSASTPHTAVESADHPFILEFPVEVSELKDITNHRRIREHRRLTSVLNILLLGDISCALRRSQHLWAKPAVGGSTSDVEWVYSFFPSADLGLVIRDTPTPLPAERLQEVDPEEYYRPQGEPGKLRGDSGRGLTVPTDLDESIKLYQNLPKEHREKFDRAAYWLDMASRQWYLSASSSFACLVSAIESMVDRGATHKVFCPQCRADFSHDVPGALQRFKEFLEKYAPGGPLDTRRKKMYDLRSRILHGSLLLNLDQDVSFGMEPPGWDEIEIHHELWALTQTALRNWLWGH